MDDKTFSVHVHTREHGVLKFDKVNSVRYVASYMNRKPKVLEISRSTWSESVLVAEFHVDDIIGWSKVEDEAAS